MKNDASTPKRPYEEANPTSSNQFSQVKKFKLGALEKDEHRQLEADDTESATTESHDEFPDIDQLRPEFKDSSQVTQSSGNSLFLAPARGSSKLFNLT